MQNPTTSISIIRSSSLNSTHSRPKLSNESKGETVYPQLRILISAEDPRKGFSQNSMARTTVPGNNPWRQSPRAI